MKTRFFLFFLFLTHIGMAEDITGIKFEHGLSWEEVQAKARKENKYIFVDVYTTWCGPCKKMDRDVFPLEKVGRFFNTHFINIKVQADTTRKDGIEVQRWYKDAQLLSRTYSIRSYPTFLFFNPQGELVHRINEGSANGDEFLAKAEAALTGYPKQKWQFQNGKSDSLFLRDLIRSAQLMNDQEVIPVVITKYLRTQKDLLTTENLKYIALSTTKTSDPGFLILRDHADKADAVLGKGTSHKLIKTIVFDEVVLPHLRINGVKKKNGGMVSYSGELNRQVNWLQIEKELKNRYPDLAEEIILTAKPMYFQWLQNWPEYVKYIALNKNKIEDRLLQDYANHIFLFCDNQESLEAALGWTKEFVLKKEKKNTRSLYTYSCLLYKTGKKQEAIKVMDEAIVLAGNDHDHLTLVLEKMKSGKKTW